ncbi:GumC domain-containing protein [Aquirhabdus parva]|nr:hypothetical protein [Aquirhabdus parva]
MPNSNEANSIEDTLDLSILWQVIKISWRRMFITIFVAMIISLLLAFILPKKWEATGTLQVGRMPSLSGDSRLIEEPPQTVERIKLREFKENVLARMHLPTEEHIDNRSDLVYKSLKGATITGADFVDLVVRGYSMNDAANTLNAATAELKAQHLLIVQPIKNRLTKELAEINDKLNQATLEEKNINNQMSAAGIYKPNAPFSPSIVASNLLVAKESEIRALKAQQIQYNALLASFDEQSTKIINRIYVSKMAIFPNKIIFLGLGFIIGSLIAFGLALHRYSKISSLPEPR